MDIMFWVIVHGMLEKNADASKTQQLMDIAVVRPFFPLFVLHPSEPSVPTPPS